MAKKRKDRETEIRLKALGHEVRRGIMESLIRRKDSAPVSTSEFSGELGVPLSRISYHVRVLAGYEAITLVSTRPAWGSVEYFYRPVPKFLALPWVKSILDLDSTTGTA